MVAAFTLDSLRLFKTRGPTRLMIRPMIVITTRISIKVKPSWCLVPEVPAFSASRQPRCKLRSGRRIPCGHMLQIFMAINPYSSDDLAHRHKSGHDRNDQAADNDADADDRQGAGDPDQPIEAALKLGFVKLRDALREHGQLTRLFAEPQGPNGHRRNHPSLGERVGKLAAVADEIDGPAPGGGVSRRCHQIREDS